MNVLSLPLFLTLLPAADDPQAYFRDNVRPILQKCVGCHGGDEPSGMLDLTSRGGAIKGGETGPALKPGNTKDSLLFAMTSSKAMPPKKPLSAEELQTLRRWIESGAAWEGTLERKKPPKQEAKRAGPDWWSLQPVRRPSAPQIRIPKPETRNPIDRFILARLEKEGLTLAPAADPATLLRRLTFDLTGLPPTPMELDAFLQASIINPHSAIDNALDRLLASPHYGERWARHWLDVARFGESQGFERDKLRDHAWRYRDYVIRSFNEDKPYPQFVREQIAGDVLNDTRDGVIATGFLVAGPWDEVGATQQGALMRKRAREEELEDMVSAVAQTFLGLTVNCARCHNHKFDPILQRDYYRLKAALEGVYHGDRPIITPEQASQREKLARKTREEIERHEKELADLEKLGRAKLNPDKPQEKALVEPLARWSFEGDAKDSHGTLHGELIGGAVVRNGRLHLNGTNALVRTAPLTRPLKAKTLETWVMPANLTQRGGGVLTVQTDNGATFDSIVLGERQPGKWMAGSNGFVRTRDVDGPAENAPDAVIHVAITYQDDGTITAYRNGKPYGAAYVPPQSGLVTYAAKTSQILLGQRHTGGGNAFFAGEIEEARLYDRALTAADIAASFSAGIERVPLDKILAALTPEQRLRHALLSAELKNLRDKSQIQSTPVLAYAANPRTPEPTFLLLRGDVEKQGERVAAAGPEVIKTPNSEWGLAPDAPEAERRKKLADWLAHPEHPLVARVLVNRVWQYHFGKGLVATPSDFGFTGGLPSHPELLDWLAAEFTRSGGSIKHLHRLIVTSAVYTQSSRFDAKAAGLDADNRLLWRFSPRRLEGEAARDAMLAISGELNRTLGGPSFRPFKLRVFNSNFYDLIDPEGPEFNRRTIYRMNVGSAKSPLLESFDCPDPSVKTPQRGATTTPLQALGMMNGSFVLRQSARMAARLRAEAGDQLESQVRLAYRLVFARPPSEVELNRALELSRTEGVEDFCWVLLNASEFLYVK